VCRSFQQANWNIILEDLEGGELYLGESFIGAPNRARAVAVAEKVGSRTGIPIEVQGEDRWSVSSS